MALLARCGQRCRYTRPQLKTYLNRHYRPGTDFILYTGTSGKQTEEEHRGRLLSVLSVDLTKSYRTEEVVSEESWRWAQANYPGQWEFSFGVVRGWNFDPPPLSSDALPHSYPLMGQYPNPGMVLPIQPEERDHITGLAISEVSIAERRALKKALAFQAMLSDKALNEEAVRISELIHNRVASGSLQTRSAPLRNAPADLILLVAEKLREQPLSCALCGGANPGRGRHGIADKSLSSFLGAKRPAGESPIAPVLFAGARRLLLPSKGTSTRRGPGGLRESSALTRRAAIRAATPRSSR
jgi:hypothetical protein